MGVKDYIEEVLPGVRKTFYEVRGSAINEWDGKRKQFKRKGISSKPKAQRLYNELWHKAKHGKPWGEVKNFGQLKLKFFEDFEDNLRSEKNPEGHAPDTLVTKKSRFAHLKAWDSLRLKAITPKFVVSEISQLVKNGIISQNLSVHILKEVKLVFRFAVSAGYLENSPILEIKNRSRVRKAKSALNLNEINYFLSEAKRRKHKYYKVWFIALTTGMRRSEIAGLEWTDFDLENGLISLSRQDIPGEGVVERLKNGRDRVSTLPKHTLPEYRRMMLEAKGKKVIELDDHKWLSGHQSQVTKAFCREIGIKEVTFHQLRASYITATATSSVSLGAVKESVGHVKISTTNEYHRASGVHLKGALDGYGVKVPKTQEEIKEARDGKNGPLRVVK